MKKSTNPEKSAHEDVAKVETAIANPQPSACPECKPDEDTRRISRLWKLYCARVGAADLMHDMRGVRKIFRDELKNAETSLEVYGPQWRERLDEIAEELAYFKRLGLPHPSLTTVSGAQVEQPVDNGGNE